MAQGTAPSVQQAGGVSERLARAEQLIDQRLEETRKRVKTTDIAVSLFLLALGVCAYLLVAAVVDHWAMPLAVWLDELLLPEGTRALSHLLPAVGLFEQPAPLGSGGLSAAGRLAMWLVLVGAVAVLVVRRLLPVVLFRINPVFAAYTIEQSRPSLKNSLINLLLLRREKDEFVRDDLARRVFEGLEFRTAGELVHVSPDAAVDRSRLIRLGYGLVAVVALLCLYLIFSPKNPIVSMRRVMWPWAELQAPTRVTIRQVDPGDTVAYQGDTLLVSAEVRGLKADESPTLYFTTVDRQTVGEAVPMAPAGTYRFQCELPPGKLGLSQSLEYFISAGDAITRTYSVEVQVPLSIAVERIDYQYPAYTGKAAETVEGTGDIKALEGTEVTLHARANQPIEKASIELNCDSRNARRMESRGQSARVAFFLRMNPQEPTQPEYTSYHLRFVDPQGRENRRPIRYRIEVLPDLPPEVRIVTDLPEEIRLPRNGYLDVALRAEDPDFGLRKVGIRAQCQDKTLPVPPLLDIPRYEKAHRGPLEGTCRIEPARLGLQVGDKVVFWAEAEDNRELATGPAPNRAETEKRLIVIVPDESPKKPPPGQPAGGKKPDQGPRMPNQPPKPGQPAQPPEPPNESEPPGDQDQPQPPAPRPQQPTQQPQEAQDSPDRDPRSPDAKTKPQSHDGNATDSPSEQLGSGEQSQAKGEAGAKQHGSRSQGETKDHPAAEPAGHSQDPSGAGQQPSAPGQEQAPAQAPSGGDQEQRAGQQQKPAGSQRPRQPVNSRTNPGDAIEEILRHKQQQSHEQPSPAGQDSQVGQAPPDSRRLPSAKPSPSAKEQSSEETAHPDQRSPTHTPPPSTRVKPGSAPSDRQVGSGEKEKSSASQERPQGPPEGPEKSGQPDMSVKQPSPEKESAGDAESKVGEASQPGMERTASPAEDSRSAKPPRAEPSKSGQTPPEQPQPTGSEKPPTGQEAAPAAKPAGSEKPSASKDSSGTETPAEPGKLGPAPKPQATEKQKPASGEKQTGSAEEKPQSFEGAQPAAKPESLQEPSDAPKSRPAEIPQSPEKPSAPKDPSVKPVPHEPGCTCDTCRGGGGAGKPGQSAQAPPLPQEANQPRPAESKPAMSPAAKEAPAADAPQSPSTSAKQSRSKGQDAGDRSGGGKQGGGQGAQEQGPGMAGSQSDADQGADTAPQPGQGPTGSKPGEQASADKSPGKPTPEQAGQAAQNADQGPGKPGGEPAAGSAKPTEPTQGKPPADEPSASPAGQPGDSAAPGHSPGGTPGGKTGGGAQNPQGGGLPGKGEPPPTAEATQPQADDPILEYTRRQTNLALRHLEEEASKERSDLLERLGWTPQQAREFIEWYRKLEQAATKATPEGQAARRERDAWLKSLGLRPRGTELRGGTTPADKLQNLKDPGRIAPPPKWRSQFRAFTEGLGSQQP